MKRVTARTYFVIFSVLVGLLGAGAPASSGPADLDAWIEETGTWRGTLFTIGPREFGPPTAGESRGEAGWDGDGSVTVMPLRPDAPTEFAREDAIDFVDPARRRLTTYDRLAVFYTPPPDLTSRDGDAGFLWEIAFPGQDHSITHGYELDQKCGAGTTFRPAKAGSPGKFAAVVELDWPSTYELRVCPVRPEGMSLLGAAEGPAILPDRSRCRRVGTFALEEPQLRFKDFLLEPFPPRPLPAGEYLGESQVSLHETVNGRELSLSLEAHWMRTEGADKHPVGTEDHTAATAVFTFPETLAPGDREMGEGLFTVTQPADFDGNRRNARTPYNYYLEGFLAIRFQVGGLYAIAQAPPERTMFWGAGAARAYGADLKTPGSPARDFEELSRGWGGRTEKQLLFLRENGQRNQRFGLPEQTLAQHLEDEHTLFVVPVRAEVYEKFNTGGEESGKLQVWGYAIYGTQPGRYTGPMPVSADETDRDRTTGATATRDEPPEDQDTSGPDSLKPIRTMSPDSPGRENVQDLDPTNPQVAVLIAEWLRRASGQRRGSASAV